jgi:hypothetical protein
MNKTLPTLLIAAAAAIVTVIAPLPGFAADSKDEALNLDQHTNPDVTPRDRYQAALDKAADALKKNLAHCDKLQAGERAECVREARALYDGDVAKASDVLNRPQ